MVLVFNAATTGVSGTLSVAINVSNYIRLHFPLHELYFVTCEPDYVKPFLNPTIEIIPVSRIPLRYTHRYFFDSFTLPMLVKKLEPDLLVNFDNLPVKTPIKQLSIVGNPYYAVNCKELRFLKMPEKIIPCFRRWLFYRRLKYVNKFVFQTDFMAERVMKYARQKFDYHIIPNFHNEKRISTVPQQLPEKEEGYKYLTYLTFCYRHKNLDILPEVARLIKKKRLGIKLWVSFQGKCEKIYDRIVAEGNGDVVYNLGHIHREQTAALYAASDGIFFPSILESFSQIMYDAMVRNLPVFISNQPYAKTVFGDAVFYFDPYDAESIVNTIAHIFDRKSISEKTGRYPTLLKTLPDNDEIALLYVDIIKSML